MAPRPKGFHHSEETKERMRLKALGRVISEEQKEKIRIAHTGKKLSEEHKLHIAESLKGHKNKLGYKYTKEQKEHCSERWKKVWNDLRNNPEKLKERNNHVGQGLKGKKLSIDHRIKLSAGQIGIDISEWKGFRTDLYERRERFSREFTKFILTRDNHCMICHLDRNDAIKLGKGMAIHHIDYNKKLTIEQNCLLLCNSCHSKTNFNREQWKPFFQSLLSKLYEYKYENGNVVIEVLN